MKATKQKQVFYFELTDLFDGECNYSMIRRYKIKTYTLEYAIKLLKKYLRSKKKWYFDGWRYVNSTKTLCFYDNTDEVFDTDFETLDSYMALNY